MARLVRLEKEPAAGSLGLGGMLITALLVSPHTDTHHLSFLLIPFSLLYVTGQWGFSVGLPYAFFAVMLPLMTFKFLDFRRAVWMARHPVTQLGFSLPFLGLFLFWWSYRKKLLRLDAR